MLARSGVVEKLSETKDELEFVYENRGPKALPTYAVIPGLNIMGGAIANVKIKLAMFVKKICQ